MPDAYCKHHHLLCPKCVAEPVANTANWISVEDDMPPSEPVFSGGPETSKHVLVATEGGSVTMGWRSQTDKQRQWKWRTHYISDAQVTHWMPLPPHPTVPARRKR